MIRSFKADVYVLVMYVDSSYNHMHVAKRRMKG